MEDRLGRAIAPFEEFFGIAQEEDRGQGKNGDAADRINKRQLVGPMLELEEAER